MLLLLEFSSFDLLRNLEDKHWADIGGLRRSRGDDAESPAQCTLLLLVCTSPPLDIEGVAKPPHAGSRTLKLHWLRRMGFANCYQAHDTSRCVASGLITYADA